MPFSIIPILFAVQLLAVAYASKQAKLNHKLTRSGWITFLLFLMLIWGTVSTWLALRGIYLSKPFLEAYPTFWLPFIPVILIMTILMFFKQARFQLRQLIDATPIKGLVGIHILRILAIGALIKASQGKFSLSFALWVGIPDMIFGFTALLVLLFGLKKCSGKKSFLFWNLLGVFAILPGAPIIGQMGLPGFMYATIETPDMTTLYEFPMVLAPSLVVPIFVAFNLLVAIRLIEQIIWGDDAFLKGTQS